jgi:transposase InsO family protein
MVGTFRRECLDHVIPVDERHRRTTFVEFVDYYNTERPHRALRLDTPRPASRSTTGAVVARPVLGGLHHAYARAA